MSMPKETLIAQMYEYLAAGARGAFFKVARQLEKMGIISDADQIWLNKWGAHSDGRKPDSKDWSKYD